MSDNDYEYTIEVVIKKGNDEFWENAFSQSDTGAEQVLDEVRDALEDRGFSSSTTNVSLSSMRKV